MATSDWAIESLIYSFKNSDSITNETTDSISESLGQLKNRFVQKSNSITNETTDSMSESLNHLKNRLFKYADLFRNKSPLLCVAEG